MTRIELEGEKYTVTHTDGTNFAALRYGEPWRDLTGDGLILALVHEIERLREPIDVLLFCPACGLQHIDEPQPDEGWHNPPHRSHYCLACGHTWRPADVATNGVLAVKTRGQRDSVRPSVVTIHGALEALRNVWNEQDLSVPQSPDGRLAWATRIASAITVLQEAISGASSWDEAHERELFENRSYAHYMAVFVRRRAAGKLTDSTTIDGSCPWPREELFERNAAGDYIAVSMQQAWGGWQLARGGL